MLKNNDIDDDCYQLFYSIFHINDIDETTSLHLACKYDYQDLILQKIQDNFDINTIDTNGNTILHISLLNNNMNLSKFFILSGASINIENNNGETQFEINKLFVEEILDMKKKIENYKKTEIKTIFDKNCSLYEREHINTICSYINNYDETYNFTKTI